MKIVDVKVGEVVLVTLGDKSVSIIPKQKSGSKMRIGIAADMDVKISNPKPLLEEGL